MRITSVRVIFQVFFFGLFLFLVFVTTFGRMKGYPVSLFLEADPLVGIGTAITTHSLHGGLVWMLVILVPTLLLGRVFCNWVCPFGILHHFIGWLFDGRDAKAQITANRYRPLHAVKYCILTGMLVAGVFGSLQTGLLDPIPTLFRSFTVAVLPSFDAATGWVYVRPHEHGLAWVIGGLFVFFVGMNLTIPRFFCRALCPLGAALGMLSRFSLWRIARDEARCTDCNGCLRRCEGASDPHARLRRSECFVCMNCLDDCPTGAIRFAFLPPKEGEVPSPDVGRRRAAFAAAMGLFFYPLARTSGKVTKDFDKKAVRPPGSVAEPEFLARCIKCDQCLRVCPTNVLQPALFEAGLEGVWTPVLNNRMGYCELNCVLCGQVCPTGAIRRLTLEEKLGVGAFAERGPVRVGTAFYDYGRCLPWAMDTPCVVCEEVCPTSPKAIFTRPAEVVRRDGGRVTLRRPAVDPERCIGCGICEHECPVKDEAAIRVTAIGESRSRERGLLLSKGDEIRRGD